MKSNAKERILTGFSATEAAPQRFVEELIAGDGNCGFTVLGIDRKTLVKVLLSRSGEEDARDVLAEDILELGELKEFDPSFQPKLVELITKARAAQDVYHKTVADFYYDLNPDHQPCELDEMLEVIQAFGNEGLDACISRQRSLFEDADGDLADFCSTEDIYKAYVESYRGNLWISRRCAVLYGQYTGISVYIWQYASKESSQLVLLNSTVSANKDARVVHMLWKNGNHFNRLIPMTEPQLPQEAEQKSAQEFAENQPATQKTGQLQPSLEEVKWLSKDEAERALISFLLSYTSSAQKMEAAQKIEFAQKMESAQKMKPAKKAEEYIKECVEEAKENTEKYLDYVDLFSNVVDMFLYPGVNHFHQERQRSHYSAVLRGLNKDRLRKYQIELALKAIGEILGQFEKSYGGKLDEDSKEYDPSATLDPLYYQAILDNINRDVVKEYQPRLYTSLPRDKTGNFDTSKMDPHEIYLRSDGRYYIKDEAGTVSGHNYSVETQDNRDLRLSFHDSVFRNKLRALTIKNGHAQQPGTLQTVFYNNEVTQTLLNSDFKGPIPLQVDKEVRHYQFFNESHTAQTVLLQQDESFPFTSKSIVYCPSEPRLVKNNEQDGKVLSRQEIVEHLLFVLDGSILQRSRDVIRKQLGRSIFRYLISLKCYEPDEVIVSYRDQKEAVVCFFSDVVAISAVLHAHTLFRKMLTGDPSVDINKLKLLLNDRIMSIKLNDYASSSKKYEDGAEVIDSLVKKLSSGKDAKGDLKSIVDYFEDEGSNLCSNVRVIENFLKEVDGTNKKSSDGVQPGKVEDDTNEKSTDDLFFEDFEVNTDQKWTDSIWLDKNLLSAFKKAMEVESLPTICDLETLCWYEEREEIEGSLDSYCERNNIKNSIRFEVIGAITPPNFSEFGRVWRLATVGKDWINEQKNPNTLAVVERSGHYYRLVPKENQLGVFVALFSKQGMEKTKNALLKVLPPDPPKYDNVFSYHAFVCDSIASVQADLMKELQGVCASIKQNEENLDLRSHDVAQIVAHDKDLSSKKEKLDVLGKGTSDDDTFGNVNLKFLFDFLVGRLNSENPLKIRRDNLKDPVKMALEPVITDQVRRAFLRQIVGYGFTIDSIKTHKSRTLLFVALEKNLPVEVLTRLLALQPDPFIEDAKGKSPIQWLREEVIRLKDQGDKAEQLTQTIEKFNLLLKYVVKKLGGRLDAHSKLIEDLEDIQKLDGYAQQYIKLVQLYLPKHCSDLIKPRRLYFGCVDNRGALLVSVLATLWERLGERQYGQIIDELRKKTDEAELGFFRTIGSKLLRSTRSFIARGMKVVITKSYGHQTERFKSRMTEMVLRGEIHDIYSKVDNTDRQQKNNAAEHKEDTRKVDAQVKSLQEEMKSKDEKIAAQATETEALKGELAAQAKKTGDQEKETAELKAKMAVLEARMMELFKTGLPDDRGAQAPSLPSAVSTEEKPAIVQGGGRPEVVKTNPPRGYLSSFFATVPDPLSKGSEGEAYTNVYDEAEAGEVFPLDF